MIDARQLEAFEAVVQHGSFGAAAQALHLTLPAISQRLRALETTLGQRVLVRGKALRPTSAGKALLAHVQRVKLSEADWWAQHAAARADGARSSVQWQTLRVAVNADSLASWFLPGVAEALREHHLLLDVSIDDQDHTHALLRDGEVSGCVSTEALPMRGCRALPLGVLRYQAVAAPSVIARIHSDKGRVQPHQLLSMPAITYNRKDAMQDRFLHDHFGLRGVGYPRHTMPSVNAFNQALDLGLGWGMLPDVQRAQHPHLQPLMKGGVVDERLYWHHWERESLACQRLTQAVVASGKRHLPQPPAA